MYSKIYSTKLDFSQTIVLMFVLVQMLSMQWISGFHSKSFSFASFDALATIKPSTYFDLDISVDITASYLQRSLFHNYSYNTSVGMYGRNYFCKLIKFVKILNLVYLSLHANSMIEVGYLIVMHSHMYIMTQTWIQNFYFLIS